MPVVDCVVVETVVDSVVVVTVKLIDWVVFVAVVDWIVAVLGLIKVKIRAAAIAAPKRRAVSKEAIIHGHEHRQGKRPRYLCHTNTKIITKKE